MKIPFSWLKEYVEIDITPEQLEEKLFSCGFEVEELIYLGKDITGVVVGEVKECEPIPETHLHVCKVDAGTGELLQICCGADNVCAGKKFPVALDGATVYATAKDHKTVEGVASFLMGELKNMFLTNTRTKLAYLLLKDSVSDLKHQMDSEEYGGAPFLGAKQPVIKAHGSSKAKGIKNAIRQAKICVENDLCGTMQSALDELAAAQKTEE